MCRFKVEDIPYPNGQEYIAKIKIGEFYSHFSFEAISEKESVEITYPSKEELCKVLEPNCIRKLEEELWEYIRLRELILNYRT
ncbi:hypothetical protein [Priestia megaterium]|uniref:hypothetical protein n=1 Tax=Priestia megaterium TaxID=1404 RepID=UPI0018CFC271|nr:hypothetical protein [Priestia megaterium]MBG9471996.1 hypothetical protein [Priestia megaterium]